MKIKRYLFTLLLIPVLFFTAKSYAQNNPGDYTPTEKTLRPFLVKVINQDGSEEDVSGQSGELTLPDIVDDLDIVRYSEDRLSIFPDLFLEIGGVITLERAPRISVIDGKKNNLFRSWVGTVGEMLSEKNIELGSDDKVSVALDSPIQDGSEIQITRVAKTTIVDKEEIAFKIINKDDPTLKYGKTRVEPGEKGAKELKYLVTREDGEEVSRELLSNNITKQPKDEIHYIGTMVVVLSSVKGVATITNVSNSVVSANYPRGTVIRITNRANGTSIIVTVNKTWGTATAPSGVVLDLSMIYMNQLKWNGQGAGPNVTVEEIER